MDGRLGSCSLLGPSELNRLIPTKEITIFVGTWNMNGQSPPKYAINNKWILVCYIFLLLLFPGK